MDVRAWILAGHVFFTIAWSVGLLYLPRLYVYHALCTDAPGQARFIIMERKLYLGIMLPAGLLAVSLGLWLAYGYLSAVPGWLILKLTLGLLLVLYHLYLGKLLRDFRRGRNQHSHVYYRWLNEIPAVAILGIVILAIVRPF